jgi:hypothetical protein
MNKFRFIGDIHANRQKYLSLIEGCDYSLQVGDLDIFGFDWLVKEGVDPDRHKFIGGNHDNYDVIKDSPHYLGDFGLWNTPIGEIFFVRGAWSIDRKFRTIGVDWWAEEELNYQQCLDAIEFYAEKKPKIVVSHACPTNMIQHVTSPEGAKYFGYDQAIIRTKTDEMLHNMLLRHVPETHIFGHYHRFFDGFANGLTGEIGIAGEGMTHYHCLPIDGVLDFDF